jgi:hypothetical protein
MCPAHGPVPDVNWWEMTLQDKNYYRKLIN